MDKLAQLLSLQDALYTEFQQLLETLQQHPFLDSDPAARISVISAQELQASGERLEAMYANLLPFVDGNVTVLQQQRVTLRRHLTLLDTYVPGTVSPLNREWN